MKDNAVFLLVLTVLGISLLGYTLFAPPSRTTAAAVPPPQADEEEPLPPLRGTFALTPVIDPGHGGMDGGAVSLTGVLESGINLDIALKTEMLLRFLGLRPVMTRREDVSLHDPSARSVRDKKNSDLRNRAIFVNSVPDAVLISIHQNKYPQSRYSGTQVFHNGRVDNAALAELMQNRLRQSLAPDNNRKAKTTDIYLLNKAQCPAILIECGFLSNEQEEAALRRPEYQKQFALTICAGLLEWERTLP